MSGAVSPKVIVCLKALAADDGSANADRARIMLRGTGEDGGHGTPKEAQAWLEVLGESGGPPSKEEIDAAIAVRRGELRGDPIRAHRTLVRAGRRDADQFGSSEDLKTIAEVREKMHTTREPTVHWERNSRVYPQITKEEATRRIKARGDTDRGPATIPTREMFAGTGKPWMEN